MDQVEHGAVVHSALDPEVPVHLSLHRLDHRIQDPVQELAATDLVTLNTIPISVKMYSIPPPPQPLSCILP